MTPDAASQGYKREFPTDIQYDDAESLPNLSRSHTFRLLQLKRAMARGRQHRLLKAANVRRSLFGGYLMVFAAEG